MLIQRLRTHPLTTSPSSTRPLDLAVIPFLIVVAAMAFGASTNAINGLVSEQYFVTIMGWSDVVSIWRAAVVQGIFEGSLFGVVLALVFTMSSGLITGTKAPFVFYARHVGGILVGAFACWVLAGAIAVLLCLFSPEWFQRAVRGAPSEAGAMVTYAWVAGSIWGAQLGGVVSTLVGLVILRSRWVDAGGIV